jgi:hypothetical protein
MERYTEKPQTQGERRTDNTPAPVKTQKGQDRVKSMSNAFVGNGNHTDVLRSWIGCSTGSERKTKSI